MRRFAITLAVLLTLGLHAPRAEAEIRPRMNPVSPSELHALDQVARGATTGLIIGCGAGIAASLAGLEGVWLLLGPLTIAGAVIGLAGITGGEEGPELIFEREHGVLGARLEEVRGERLRIGLVGARF